MNGKQARNRGIVLTLSLLAGVGIGLWMNGEAEPQDRPAAAQAQDAIPDHAAHEAADAYIGKDREHEHEDANGKISMDMPGMSMETGAADNATWDWPTGAPKAGERATLRITITDAAGKPDAGLQVSHEKKLHLIIVSQGLSTFMHLHPRETEKPGVFDVPVTLPSAGRYKLIADFKPKVGEQQWQGVWVEAGANGKRTADTEPALAADKQLEQAADGMTVKLSLGSPPKAGEDAELAFSFADAANGQAVRDLQPYLGAAGHVVILDAAAKHYLHVHAMDGAGGPEARFHTSFPEPGLYKIWGQFQRNDRVVTVPYVIEVQ
ncbi:hypothetical protein [Paenibacillus glycinis]|uniref:Secreted protein n=1 Tax=Paenibacillus glycinis TaxID=2697035 RepID=A0ABW9XYQ4_9BACL|nr:hypothetical protein [Paenibacillus glycinis]NBD27543.1 hypothetical protein [Paenibacillus glycinis]